MIVLGVTIDALVAAVCLALLLGTMIGALDLWAAVSPNTVPLDWRGYWTSVQEDPWSGLALYLMLATTLVPTVVHLVAGIGGIMAHKSRRLQRAADRIADHQARGVAMNGILAYDTMRLVRGASLWGYGQTLVLGLLGLGLVLVSVF